MTTQDEAPRRPSFTHQVDDVIEFADGGPPGIRPIPLDFSPGLVLSQEVDEVIEFTDATPLPTPRMSGSEAADPQSQPG